MEYCLIYQGFVISHMGFSSFSAIAQNHTPLLFPEIDFQIDVNEKKQLTGHFLCQKEEIEKQLAAGADRLSIDSGCVYTNQKGLGYLCALELNGMKLFFQKNIEKDN